MLSLKFHGFCVLSFRSLPFCVLPLKIHGFYLLSFKFHGVCVLSLEFHGFWLLSFNFLRVIFQISRVLQTVFQISRVLRRVFQIGFCMLYSWFPVISLLPAIFFMVCAVFSRFSVIYPLSLRFFEVFVWFSSFLLACGILQSAYKLCAVLKIHPGLYDPSSRFLRDLCAALHTLRAVL